MGNSCAASANKCPPDYVIVVKTGDVKGAGTDANVFIAFINDSQCRSKDIPLNCRWKDDLERGSVDSYPVTNLPNFGRIDQIELWRDSSGLKDDWFVEKIEVVHSANSDTIVFPIHRWIKANTRHVFAKYDCLLPQHDVNKDQRKQELTEKKKLYEMECKATGLLPQIKTVPADESFSDDYKWDIIKNKANLAIQSKIIGLTADSWKCLDDIGKLYNKSLPVPYGMNNWRSDVEFGSQRLVSCNPNQIRRCTQIPDNLAVDDEMLKPLMEDLTTQEAIDSKRLYIMNYKVLKDLPCSYDRKICAPIALFFVNKEKNLMPVAIQLYQDPAQDNPVFLPTDPEYTWLLAKMWFNNADASYHQSATHLGFTHLIMEAVALAIHRSLSPSHPMFRLLAPHFLYLIAINSRAVAKLVCEDGWVDQCMSIGRVGMFAINARTAPEWRFDVEGSLPADLNNRGVDDPEALPKYYFRDDALLLYEAIRKYVTEVVEGHYDSPDKLADDHELQEFAEILKKPQSEGGCGIKGVHGGGVFLNTVDLIDALTAFIYTSSVAHAAANFSQYDEYAFPPNYPSYMRDEVPPKDKSPRTEQDVLNCLPNKEMTLSIMLVTKILSDRGTQCLGDFEIEYQFDPIGAKAVKAFKEDLVGIGKIIDKRNAQRAPPYPYLHPSEVPNAISISCLRYSFNTNCVVVSVILTQTKSWFRVNILRKPTRPDSWYFIMGNACVSGSSAPTDFVILVKTGDLKGAGTDADVFIALINEEGTRSRDIPLNSKWKNDMERGSIDRFPVTNLANFGRVCKIELWRDTDGAMDNWFVERVEVINQSSGEHEIFPIHRWLKALKKRIFHCNDCLLPQCDDNKTDRKEELGEKKVMYELECKVEGLIPQIKNFPSDESFSDDYKWDIVKNKASLFMQTKLMGVKTGDWKSLEDIEKIYNEHLPVPYGMNNWRSDLEFGSQRLVSCNPNQIRRCTQIPDNFAVNDEMLKPLLEDLTVQEAIDAKRLYIMDYKILKDLPCSYDRKICAPIGLFFVNKEKNLMPVAIQLFQDSADDNPVFLPTDPEYTWLLAKMWFNNADASYHQAATHLGFTHLIVESIAVATHRTLSPSHPIYRLLAPHFLYLIAINYRALGKLVSEDGWVDQCMGIGRIGMFEIIVRTQPSWRLDVEGTLPADLENRGVDDPEALPKYYFRDDAILSFGAIQKYVTEVVNGTYDDPSKLAEDDEIQDFADTLTKSPGEGGAGVQGVHGNGKFSTNEDLIGALTAIIYTSSVAHAAANFAQYDEYAFPPNYPSIMRVAEPPKDKNPRCEQDVIDCLPDKDKTLSIMLVTKILSDRGTNSLGDFEVEYQFDPVGKKAVESFRKDLLRVGALIDERNATRSSPYLYLHPKEVPNAISI
ncbi:uncharacterized protein LOC119719671 [Patiria miniata]|uniref:Allene oxide synthase-lipoxygenase protein n=1 Tax=Patiria miniata TaxID=46514 RepID=A0A913Z0A3_PATMI|nr:uncharacterized protein LOC119719671 [Patiria miniata]